MGARTSNNFLPKTPGVGLDDLAYYFDAVDMGRLEASGTSRKTAEVLALRERLLRLPDSQFDAAIKTLKALVEDVQSGDGGEGPEERAVRRQAARNLYASVAGGGSRTRGGGTGSARKVSPT